MRYLLLLTLLIVSSPYASMIITSTELNEQMASDLGFEFKKTLDKSGLTLELKGPKMFGDSCTPLASGHFVVQNGKELSAFINSAHPEEPQSIAFIAEGVEANLIVFMDYECENDAKRFTVSSNE
jgi:hypothetical protein